MPTVNLNPERYRELQPSPAREVLEAATQRVMRAEAEVEAARRELAECEEELRRLGAGAEGPSLQECNEAYWRSTCSPHNPSFVEKLGGGQPVDGQDMGVVNAHLSNP
ncbi:MAG: hypothetical protein DCC71_12170 [Proteobacteria bacterium]|nr:MAG: hypothetical protein DCC71_12170 [Pseudomonadota bacterium]